MYLLNRLREPSTWTALAVMAGVFGIKPELAHAIEGVGVGVCGLLAALLPDRGRPAVAAPLEAQGPREDRWN